MKTLEVYGECQECTEKVRISNKDEDIRKGEVFIAPVNYQDEPLYEIGYSHLDVKNMIENAYEILCPQCDCQLNFETEDLETLHNWAFALEKKLQRKLYKSNWHKKNKERLNEKSRIHYLKNKEYFKEHRVKNKEKLKKYFKEYRVKNKEKLKEQAKIYAKKYYAKNKETLLKQNRENYIKNKEAKKEYQKNYAKRNREKRKGGLK